MEHQRLGVLALELKFMISFQQREDSTTQELLTNDSCDSLHVGIGPDIVVAPLVLV